MDGSYDELCSLSNRFSRCEKIYIYCFFTLNIFYTMHSCKKKGWEMNLREYYLVALIVYTLDMRNQDWHVALA